MSLSVKVLELSGILDGIRGNELRREVSGIVANGADILLLDMKEVKFIDSSGLGALVSAMQITRNANTKLFICSIGDQVRMLFELTKMDRIFQTFADQDEFNRQVLATQ
ncbi:sulfate transporter [Nostoc sp. 'Peltigera membranacea cyanobiont' 213]|uniref:STAS domain-containing protein n=1 Tax=unclassified Nostoc TaxID=2593658 RepID=UPI000B950DDC|nr:MULTISPECIES: STAS domain-containing protein [unclassified Nostoc]AVH62228.1 anti-sigma-factor antagonist [Nostoc sp. 'Peltigera membranacea cyanobiont' N6]OYD98319.1 sulfate transporter [Nostoc sp. 'Peltigera membranacea cyanobiont' 213]